MKKVCTDDKETWVFNSIRRIQGGWLEVNPGKSESRKRLKIPSKGMKISNGRTCHFEGISSSSVFLKGII